MYHLATNYTPVATTPEALTRTMNPSGANLYTAAALFTNQGLFQGNEIGTEGLLASTSTVAKANSQSSLPGASFTMDPEENVSPSSETQPSGLSDKSQSFSSNIYVASLPETCTDAELVKLFSPYGPIVSAKVMCRKGTNTCKGYGFVLFEREEDAARAQSEMIGYIVGGNKIQVRRARVSACTPLFDSAAHTPRQCSNRASAASSRRPTTISAPAATPNGFAPPAAAFGNAVMLSPSGPTQAFAAPPQSPYLLTNPMGAAASACWPGAMRSEKEAPVVYMMVPMHQNVAPAYTLASLY